MKHIHSKPATSFVNSIHRFAKLAYEDKKSTGSPEKTENVSSPPKVKQTNNAHLSSKRKTAEATPYPEKDLPNILILQGPNTPTAFENRSYNKETITATNFSHNGKVQKDTIIKPIPTACDYPSTYISKISQENSQVGESLKERSIELSSFCQKVQSDWEKLAISQKMNSEAASHWSYILSAGSALQHIMKSMITSQTESSSLLQYLTILNKISGLRSVIEYD